MGDVADPVESEVVVHGGQDVTPTAGTEEPSAARHGAIRSPAPRCRIVRAEPAWTDDMPIFLSPRWLASQSPEYGWLVAESTPEVRLVLPYVVRRHALLRWVEFQWAVCAPEGIDLESERAFLEGTVEWCRAQGFDFIAQPTTAALFATAPAGAVSAPFGTLVLDLAPSEEALWAGMEGSNRNIIRKAIANGVIIEWGDGLVDEAHAMCTATMERSDLGFPPLEVLRRTVACLGASVDVGIARLDGVAKACVVVPWSRYGAHCLYAGSATAPAAGATNLLQWEAIVRAKAHGAARYDLLGVRLHPKPGGKHAGIRRFKQRFGAEIVEGCLWKTPLVGWKYGLYVALKRARGDGIDIIDQEIRAR